jgi:RNA polymerase sigma-70 factor (ECF subfamily)
MDGSRNAASSIRDERSDVEDSISKLLASPLDFRTLFELESGYVLRTLRRLGVAPRDVEDMAHEVFVVVHRELDRYDRLRPIRPWLFAFCFRVASHYRRKAQRETVRDTAEEAVDEADGPDALLDRARKRRLVLLALGEIELERRAVFVLHELDGVTCDAIAQSLGIPLGTVYSRLRLARQDFAAKMRRLSAMKELE